VVFILPISLVVTINTNNTNPFIQANILMGL
jgi:hypothetical protein